MLHPCDKVIGSEWDMPTHEVKCQETTCNSPISGESNKAGLVGISLYENPNSSGLFIVWD